MKPLKIWPTKKQFKTLYYYTFLASTPGFQLRGFVEHSKFVRVNSKLSPKKLFVQMTIVNNRLIKAKTLDDKENYKIVLLAHIASLSSRKYSQVKVQFDNLICKDGWFAGYVDWAIKRSKVIENPEQREEIYKTPELKTLQHSS